MKRWAVASRGEQRLYWAIEQVVGESRLLEFLFDSSRPKLRQPADELLKAARGLSSGEYLLVKLALDLWCEQGQMTLTELLELEEPVFCRALQMFVQLRQGSIHVV